MPTLDTRIPEYKPGRTLEAEYNNFRRGLNLLERPTELDRNTLSQSDNIMLTGSGVPTGRWGTGLYFTAGSSGRVRGLFDYRDPITSTAEIFALTDEGYIQKKDGSISTVVTGQSYPSGALARGEQLGGYTYIVSDQVPMVRYDGTSIESFVTISSPIDIAATNVSGVSGPAVYSWQVIAVSETGGKTTALGNTTLVDLPQDLADTLVRVSWNAPTLNASLVAGYEIYRGTQGNERLLAAVGPSTTSYEDTGAIPSNSVFPPEENTTGGYKSNLIRRVKDRLVMVDVNDPSLLVVSARYPDEVKTSWLAGGAAAYIAPNDGFKITGIEPQPGSDRIIVFKETASYSVSLNLVSIGSFDNLLSISYEQISNAVGCSSPDTIQTVENDVFYFGSKGLYVVGYEPNFLSIIRTNEISARMRPYINRLGEEDFTTAVSFYVNNKYILSFPRRKEMLVYDRERGAFAGIWRLPFGVSAMKLFVDETGNEKWVLGSYEDNKVYTFEPSLNSDSGTTITKTIRTNKESFGVWDQLKIVQLFHVLFRKISGTVTINILGEDRNGVTSTVKSFTITGSEFSSGGGWGSALWGAYDWGETIADPIEVGEEVPRWSQLFKSLRLIQIEVTTSEPNSNFELLNMKMTATSQGPGSLSSSQRV